MKDQPANYQLDNSLLSNKKTITTSLIEKRRNGRSLRDYNLELASTKANSIELASIEAKFSSITNINTPTELPNNWIAKTIKTSQPRRHSLDDQSVFGKKRWVALCEQEYKSNSHSSIK